MARSSSRVRTLGMGAVCLFIGLMTIAFESRAQTCVASNVSHTTSDYRREYRVSTTNLDGLQGFSTTAARRVIVASADRWNEQSNARPFRYGGTVPETDVDCGEDYSLVVVDTTTNSSSRGLTEGRCSNSQFLITLFARDSSGNLYDWQYDETVGSSERDLMQTIVHEFGHTLRQGHPNSTDYGVMMPTSAGETRQRDLYRVDMKCSTNWSGHRRTHAYERFMHTNGTWNSELDIFGSGNDIARISVGITHSGSNYEWAAAAKKPTCPFYAYGLDDNNTVCVNAGSTSEDDYIGPLTLGGDYNASPWEDRIFHVSYDEYPTNGDEESDHRLRYMRSSDAFDSYTRDFMNECSSMSGWLTCSSFDEIRTGIGTAYAWDDYSDQQVLAWVHQNRDNSSYSRRVYLSVGK